MTALDEFERLECEGLYDPGDGSKQSVFVQFGTTSLTIATFDDFPLAHWPLASLSRQVGVQGELTISPDGGAREKLIITDGTMRDVLDSVVSKPLEARPQKRARRILPLALLFLTLGIAGLAATVDAYGLIAARLPREAVAQLGREAVAAHAGPAICRSRSGQPALVRLVLSLNRSGQVLVSSAQVVRGAGAPAAAAGEVLLIPQGVIGSADGPEELGALIVASLVRHDSPLRMVLRTAGLSALPALLDGHLTAPPLVAAAAAVLADQRGAPLPASTGDSGVTLSSVDWRSLKTICSD